MHLNKSTNDEFIIKSNLIHKKWIWLFISEYNGNKIKVKIICKVHGIFEQLLIISKLHKCPSCTKFDINEFTKRSKLIHGISMITH
jgi:hypothetical protein